ncbi:hypothetical protein BPOR_0028g00010 [Botrytis porri]|uniref:Uncharacterized protein n=1 Tax=Botrytis porri TaxID=87229 RepID=A0A4Z1L3P3_9HELO|nr:hypothetical protein BPOR_0028g00010 [Botrytis porri]
MAHSFLEKSSVLKSSSSKVHRRDNGSCTATRSLLLELGMQLGVTLKHGSGFTRSWEFLRSDHPVIPSLDITVQAIEDLVLSLHAYGIFPRFITLKLGEPDPIVGIPTVLELVDTTAPNHCFEGLC